MRRRVFLAATASVFATGGCLAGGTESDGERKTPPRKSDATPTTTDRPRTGVSPTLVETSFEETGTCESPGSVTITPGDGALTVEGCLEGADGCTVASLEAILFDTATESVSVVVGTDDQSGPDAACTQALVNRGYEVSVAFAGGTPETVTVVHDDVRGRREVASEVTEQ